jgi:hypothetical protein
MFLDFQQIDSKLNNMMSYMNSFFNNMQKQNRQQTVDPSFAQGIPNIELESAPALEELKPMQIPVRRQYATN